MEMILKVHRIPPILKLKHISAQYKVQLEMKRTHDNEEKWKGVLPRPAVDVRAVIYGLTSLDCTTAHPGVTKDTCGEMKNKLLLAAGSKGCIGINDYSYFLKSGQ
jgi:hypothetical protein